MSFVTSMAVLLHAKLDSGAQLAPLPCAEPFDRDTNLSLELAQRLRPTIAGVVAESLRTLDGMACQEVCQGFDPTNYGRCSIVSE